MGLGRLDAELEDVDRRLAGVERVVARDEVRGNVRLRRVEAGVGHARLDARALEALGLRFDGVRRHEPVEPVAEARNQL